MLRLVLEPGPVRSAIVNWDDVAPVLLVRAHREAVGGVFDPDTAELITPGLASPRPAAGACDRPADPVGRRRPAVLLRRVDDRHTG